ncbi:MAG: conserved membrane protein of unknown function [Candidatus Thorarchaeota archaeon]|nr:MAG: conserved membrane protein of unknown function [Candidatus Thorarchaeota archaeon]
MVRLTTISNILAGIGLAILGFSAVLKYLLESLGTADTAFPFYTWIIAAVILGIVIFMSVITTFSEMTGFVHPEDKLVSNMFVFLITIGTFLMFGILDEGELYQSWMYNIASMMMIAFVFLFIFVFFSATITEGGDTGQVKEMTARFMLVSLVLGGILAGLKLGLDLIYDTYFYESAAGLLGIISVALTVLIVMFLGRRYEPVGE